MNTDRRATLFLIEQLLAILFFALTAAICVQIFVSSQLMTLTGEARGEAALQAQNVAESYKACAGDLAAVAEQQGGSIDGSGLRQYFDPNWQLCGQEAASYTLTLAATSEPADPVALRRAQLEVIDNQGRVLLAFPVAGREVE